MMVNDYTNSRFNMVATIIINIILVSFIGGLETTTAFTPSPSSRSNKESHRIKWTNSQDPFIWNPQEQLTTSSNTPLFTPKENLKINQDVNTGIQNYKEMIQWALDLESIDSSSNVVSIGPSKCGHGYGLYTNCNIKQGETLFEIPSSKCLTLTQAWGHPTRGKAFRTMTDDDSDQNNAVLATFLASEILSEHNAIDDGDNKCNALSKFHPYLTTIPTEKGSKEQDHILWWTDEELMSKLGHDSPSYKNAMALREWVDDMRDIVTGLLVTDLIDKDQSVSILEVRNAITASFVNVLSRSLRDETIEDGQRMVPLLDMAQHSDKPNIRYSTSSSSGSVVVKATRDLKAGEELTLEYANELTEEEFFVVFGFIPLPVKEHRSPKSTRPQQTYTIPRTSSLVPINDDTVRFTAGLLGAAFGCSVGGLVGGAIMAAALNYASRDKDGDIGSIIQNASKATLQSCNYVMLETTNNEVYKNAQMTLQSGLQQLKEKENNPNIDLNAVERAELQVLKASQRLGDLLFHEYDILNAGSIALGTVGDLVEEAINGVKKATSNLNDDEFEDTFGFQREESPLTPSREEISHKNKDYVNGNKHKNKSHHID